MNKKGIGTAAIISIILGLIVIASMGGVLWKNKAFIAEKIFGKEILPTPPAEGEFVPYEIEYTEEELQIMDSMNALTCAINAVASDRFDTSACRQAEDEEKKQAEETKEEKAQEAEKPPVPAPTGSAVASSLAGKWAPKKAQFGGVTVECGQKYQLGMEEYYTLDDIGKFVEDCALRSNLADVDTFCGKIFPRPPDPHNITPAVVYTEKDVVNWLKENAVPSVRQAIEDGDLDIDFEIPVYNSYTSGVFVCADDDLRWGTDRQVRLYANPDYDSGCEEKYEEWRKVTKGNFRSQSCTVYNFQLPQEITDEGSWNPVTWIAGYNDPKYVAYYEAFPEGMDKFWHVDGISMMTFGLIVGTAAFDIVPLVGKGVGKAVSGILKKGGKEAGEEVVKQTAKTGLREFLENLAKKGVKRTVQKEIVTESLEGVGGGVSRKVAAEAADIADNKLPGFFKRMRAKISPDYRQKLINDLATDFKKLDLSDAIPDETFAKNFVDDAAAKAGKPDVDVLFKEKELLDSYNADDIMTEFDVEVWEQEFKEQVGKSIKEVKDDVAWLSKAQKEMAEAYPDKLARDMAEESFEGFTKKISKAEMRRYAQQMAVKRFMKGMFSEGFEKMSKEQIQQNMDEAFKKFSSLSLLGRRRAVDKAAELSKDLIDADGFIDFSKIAGRPITDSKLKSQLTMDFMDAITTTQGMQITGAMKKAGWTMAKGLKAGTVGPGKARYWILDLVGIPRFARIGKTAITEATPLKQVIPVYSQLRWATKTGATTVGELGGWVKDHKYAVIALLALYGSAQDAAGEKFRPVGINSLGVDMPYIYTDPAPWNLINETQKYFIAPIDQGGDLRHQRLYLVSPCKANLIIKKDLCECNRMPLGIQHYRFSKENNPMDVKGVVLNMERLEDDQFVLDWAKKHFSEWFDMPEDEAVKSAKSFLLEEIPSKNYVSAIRNKHEFLKELDPDLHKINTVNQAMLAISRYMIMNWFDNRINGIALGATGGLFSRGEEQKEFLPYLMWQMYEPFYNLDGVTKQCFSRDFFGDVFSAGAGIYKELSGEKVKISENVFAHPVFKTDCITVQIQRIAGEDANYCIDEYPYVDTLRVASLAVQVVASVALTAVTGGAAAPVTTALVLASASVGGGFAEEYIARNAKWPAHNKEGLPPPVGKGLPIAK